MDDAGHAILNPRCLERLLVMPTDRWVLVFVLGQRAPLLHVDERALPTATRAHRRLRWVESRPGFVAAASSTAWMRPSSPVCGSSGQVPPGCVRSHLWTCSAMVEFA